MSQDEAPPTPPPHGAVPPYPEGEAPHPQRDAALAALHGHGGIGTLGVTLIGGAVAAAVGLLFAIPLVRRARKTAPAKTKSSRATPARPTTAKPAAKPKPAAKAAPAKPATKPAPQARRPRRKRTDD